MFQWMTVAEAAKALDVSTRTIYNRIAANQLQSRQDGKVMMVLVSEASEEVPDPVESFARVAGAHLVESKASMVALSDAMATFQQFEKNLTEEKRSCRLFGRLGWATAFLLLAGAGASAPLAMKEHQAVLKHHRSAHESQIASFQEDNTALSVRLEITEQQVGELKQENRQLVDQLASASAVANSIIKQVERIPASSSQELVDSVTANTGISSVGLEPAHAPLRVSWSPGVEDEASHPLD